MTAENDADKHLTEPTWKVPIFLEAEEAPS